MSSDTHENDNEAHLADAEEISKTGAKGMVKGGALGAGATLLTQGVVGASMPTLQATFGTVISGVGTIQAPFIGPLMSFTASSVAIPVGVTVGVGYGIYCAVDAAKPKHAYLDGNSTDFELILDLVGKTISIHGHSIFGRDVAITRLSNGFAKFEKTRTVRGNDQLFQVVDAGKGTIAFKCCGTDELYLSGTDTGKKAIYVQRDVITDNERFLAIKCPNDVNLMHLKQHQSQKFVCWGLFDDVEIEKDIAKEWESLSIRPFS